MPCTDRDSKLAFIVCKPFFLILGLILFGITMASNLSLGGYVVAQTPLATLTVQVIIQQNSLTPSSITPSNVRVSVSGTSNPNPSTFVGSASTSVALQSVGDFHVRVESVAGSTNFLAFPSGDCDGDVTGVETFNCILTISSTSGVSSGATTINPNVPIPGIPSFANNNPIVNSRSGPSNPSSPSAAPPAAGAVTTDANGPLRLCRGQQISSTVQNPLPGGVGDAGKLFMVPSSATYTIRGTVSIGKLLDLFKDPNQDFTIQIFADFDPHDPITLSMADPDLVGRISVGDELDPIHTTLFNVQDIRTLCNFITVIKPTSQSILTKVTPISPDQKNVSPKASLNKVGVVNQPPNKERLLAGGGGASASLVVDPTKSPVNSIVVNPPFQTCANGMGSLSTAADAQYGRYDIKGSAPDLRNIGSGTHVLEVRMTTDLVLDQNDLAKIINNNNSLIKITLWLDPGTSSARAVPFKLTEVSSHCGAVGFTSTPQIN